MDTISIIILTAVINAFVTGAIGGIIIYRIQKKIDNTYFQQQTKFVRNHEKTAEALDNIYKKYTDFEGSFSKVIFHKSIEYSKHLRDSTHNIILTDDEENLYKNDLDKFVEHFYKNRNYLSQEAIKNLEDIHRDSQNLAFVIKTIILHFFPTGKLDEESVKAFNFLISTLKKEVWKLNIKEIDLENPQIAPVIESIYKEIKHCREKLEALYKSETKTG